MVNRFKEEIEKFSLEIKESNPDYASIYTYLVDYINKVYKKDYELEEFLVSEFSRRDIIEACAYYYENSNAYSMTAIEKFLNSITKFYTGYMKPKGYDNNNLFKIYPFAKLKSDVIDFITNKELIEKQVNPPIEYYDFEKICQYFNSIKKPSIVEREISIISKLFMLYGFKLERIRDLKKGNFDFGTRLLTVKIKDNINISLELPLSLTLEIENYLLCAECRNKNDNTPMFLNTNNEKIDPGFFSHHYGNLKKLDDSKLNKFTTTGLGKYGIIKMLEAGVNVPVIKIITGMEDDVISDCTKIVYGLDNFTHINRYINSRVRAVETYDELGIPNYVTNN